jgi:hypothetical protein
MEATWGLALQRTPCLAPRNLFRVAFPPRTFFEQTNPASHFTSQPSPSANEHRVGSAVCDIQNPPQCCFKASSATMPPPALLRNSTRPSLYVCARCALRASQAPSKTTRRWIGLKYLAKVADAEKQWKEKAARITAGEEKSMLTTLEERGLIQTITG